MGTGDFVEAGHSVLRGRFAAELRIGSGSGRDPLWTRSGSAQDPVRIGSGSAQDPQYRLGLPSTMARVTTFDHGPQPPALRTRT